MKKISTLLTLVLVLALAVPAFAADVTGNIDSEINYSDGVTSISETGKIELEGLEETIAILNFSFGKPLDINEIDGVPVVELKPNVEYTGIENLTTGLQGTMGDDEDIAVKYTMGPLATSTTDISVKTYANYEMEAMTGLTVGAENDVTVTKKDSDNTDKTVLTVKPYANYETTVAEGLTVGADNSFEYATINDNVKELVIDPYANYETALAEGVTAGVESDVELKQDFAKVDKKLAKTLTVKPYVNVEQDLAEGLTLTADASYEVKALNKTSNALRITPTVEYTAIPNVIAGVKGIDDEIEDDESIMIKHDGTTTDIAVEAYANYETAVVEGLTVGADNKVTLAGTTDALDENLTIKPFANYEKALNDSATFKLENSYEVKVLNRNLETEETLEVAASVNYKF